MTYSCITIYTDASVCGETGCAGWGAWVKYGNGENIKLSGPLKDKLKCTTKAELMAIGNAIWIVNQRLKPSRNTMYVVVTDSQSAMNALTKKTPHLIKNKNKKRKAPNPEIAELAKAVNKMIPLGCCLKVNKVKAHSKDDGKRSYVNDIVDKLAIAEMRKLRRFENERQNQTQAETGTIQPEEIQNRGYG